MRAPVGMRKLGLGLLLRVKEEPRLAMRYLSDGAQLLWIGLSWIAPLGFWLCWNKGGHTAQGPSVRVAADQSDRSRIIVTDAAHDGQLAPVALAFRSAALGGHSIILDLRDLKFLRWALPGIF